MLRRELSGSLPDWASHALQGDLFCTGPWFSHFAATALSSGEPARFVQWQSGDGDVALALALKEARAPVLPHARLLESMASYYSCGYGPIASAPAGASAYRGLAEVLARAARGHDGVALGPLDRESVFARTTVEALRAAGFMTFWTLAYRNWYAATAGMTYAQYLQRVASSFPATSEKRRRAFLRKGQGTIEIVSAAEGLQPFLEAYQEVYSESWKVPEPYPSFMPGLIRLAGERGWLRLGILRVDGEPAAAQLWFVADGRALIYKVAYVERHAKLSVGSMLSCAMLEHVIDVDRVREVDFLSGDDAYKAKWMFERRDRHTLLAFNPRRWRGLLAGLRETLAQRRDALRHDAVPSPTIAKDADV
ncbi:MAG: GNAT family N-acetyltransferase [Piscinibacter sp.]|nr:GNAT family N-acetyltransferase [Piscinibacter sp.]